MDETLVPVIAILVIFGLPIGGFIVVRILAHRERMEMLRRGMMPPSVPRGWGRGRHGHGPWAQGYAPPGPSAAPMGDPGNLWCENETAQDSLRRGIKVTMIGLALLIGLSFIGYHGGSGPFGFPEIVPGPWLLGGLIPTFVGASQILIAMLSGARFGPYAQPGNVPPPSSPGASAYEPPRPARPVNSYEELSPPPRPPERR